MQDFKLILDGRNRLSLSGIEKVNGITENGMKLEMGGSGVTVTGRDIEVLRLDVDAGILEVKGKIDSFRFCDKAEKISLVKRIFK